MKRLTVLFFASLLITACATPQAGDGERDGRLGIISAETGQQAPTGLTGAQRIVDNQAEARRLGIGELPELLAAGDRMLIYWGMAQQNTGGYAITIQRVVKDGNTLKVYATTQQPGDDAMVTMALTSPWSAVVVPEVAYRDVEWIKIDD
jgi:hypothetical protein